MKIKGAPVPGTRRWAVRLGTDGFGRTLAYVWAGTMEAAREAAGEYLVHGGLPYLAETDQYTVHAEVPAVPVQESHPGTAWEILSRAFTREVEREAQA